jgi:predicted nucleic acid-binding protein
VQLVLDADSLIKLCKAGVLEQVAQAFQCVIPEAVYHEAVVRGKERLYPDAEEIERIVMAAIPIHKTPAQYLGQMHSPGPGPDQEKVLGPGETAVLALAQHIGESVIISDDRQFLALLHSQHVPFLPPTGLIVAMTHQQVIPKEQAREALDRMRPLISRGAYQDATQDLEERENEI